MTNVRNSGPKLEAARAKPTIRSRLRTWLLGLSLVVGLAAMACSQGTYPLDIFYEMHYQQSYKSQEPPYIVAVESAVAWFPGPKSTTSFGTDGQHLFNVNCSMCHGPLGKGDGPVLRKLIDGYGYQPLVDPNLAQLAGGEAVVMAFMRSGVNVMPNFSKLLNPEEQAAIAEYVTGTLQK